MTTLELLSHLRELDVRLWVEGGRLRFSAPPGALAPDLRQEMARNKEEIVGFLSQATSAADSPAPPLVPVPRDGQPPLSFAQQRLWFLDQLEPGSPAYNLPAAVRVSGALDVAALGRSVDEVVKRHEALRTVFAEAEGRPVQVIAPALRRRLPVVDLRRLAAPEREAEARRLAAREARRPFDLARGPLLRLGLIVLEEAAHLLLVSMHHIISDNWSHRVFIYETAAFYRAFAARAGAGAQAPWPPELPIQYADFTVWQRQWLQGKVLESLLAYWRRQLAAAPAVLELPGDRPRPPVRTFRGATRRAQLPRALSDALASLGHRHGVTLFMTLLAAFDTLLCRHTRQLDLLVGSPIAGRNRQETEGLIGFFVNTLVLRGDLSGDPPFAELLERVRGTALAAYGHQDLPFEKLVEELDPERDRSRTPLFQVMLVLQEAPLAALELPGLTLTPLDLDTATAKFDLYVTLEATEQGLRGTWEHSTDLFDATTIERLSRHFRSLLRQAAADPERRLSELPMLSGAESHQTLWEWQDTSSAAPRLRSLYELIAAQAEQIPEAVAVVCEDRSVTYGELGERAARLARRLVRSGVGPEVRVGLSVRRSPEMVAALLGVLGAGGAYVPIDPSYPRRRRAYILEDSEVGVLVSERALTADLPASGAAVILLEDLAAAGGSGPPAELPRVGPEHCAYVIYTSGSTGRPKGTRISHGALVNFLTSMAERPGLAGGDVLLAVTSLSFDIAGLELYLPLLVGARIDLARSETAADGAALAERLRTAGATVLQATPATWRMLLAAGWRGGSGLVALSGGEALAPSLAAALLERCAAVWNLYGPTETTVWSTLDQVEPGQPVTIGRPIANTAIRLLGRRFEPLPPGVPAELLIGGEGLTQGYLGRPRLTAEKLVPDPWSREPGARLYRTGDLARYRFDGRLEHLGRLDHQVKLRGFRIELGEVEAALGRHPAVAAAAVVVRELTPGDPRLLAYAVRREGESATMAEVRDALKRQLPEHMIPAAFVELPALPLTPNGKVDRRALPDPEATGLESETAHVAPRSPLEEALAAIWCQVLGREEVGIHHTFFDLGGHSLLATRVISRLRSELQVDLPVVRLFEAPTVAGLARQVEEVLRSRDGTAAAASGPVLERLPRRGELPLSYSQERLWLLVELDPGTPAYNIVNAVRLEGRLDAAAFEASLNEVVRRHEVLRTTFTAVGGRPQQVISPPAAQPLPRVELRHLAASRRRAEAGRLAAAAARTSFDLTRGPLLRALLLRLGETEHVFVFVIHHIVFDGWSESIFLEEIAACYEAISAAGRAGPELPPEPAFQYVDFAGWQKRRLQGETLKALLAFWRRQLDGADPLLRLPTDRPRPPLQTSHGAKLPVAVPAALAGALRELSRRHGVTLFMTLLAAFEVLLHRYTGQRGFSVGTFIANRNRAEIEKLIGFFVNTLILRADLAGNPGFAEVLRRVRQLTLEAYAHQDLPLEKLLEELQPERNMSYTPLFQVMLVFHNLPARILAVPGLEMRPLAIEGRVWAHSDWTLWLWETDGGELEGYIDFNTDLFDTTSLHRLLGQWQTLLEGVVARPGGRPSELPLLAPPARHQLLVGWNDTRGARPAARACIHRLFEAQVERTPTALALVSGEERLTYRELDQRANRLAHYLGTLGVGPEVLVGLAMDRCPAMVIALLGILKAGGAYLPLDPEYPRERLSLMMDDARIPVLVTRRHLLADAESPARVVVVWEDIADRLGRRSAESPAGTVTAGNLAYVIYTSGSSGRPKGVQITHAALSAFAAATADAYALGADDRVLQFASLSFDTSGEEIYPALIRGATLVLRTDAMLASPQAFIAACRSRRVTILDLPTAYWHELTMTLTARDWAEAEDLRLLIIGGEKPRAETFEPWWRQVGARVPLFNTYGPTETTVVATMGELGDPARDLPGLPMGRPMRDVRAFVLAPDLRPVPVSVAGELCLGGRGLARGYLSRPALSAERFLPDPFSEEPGERLYRTGDRVRLLPDGRVRFLGRVDQQVKVRGFRIEPGEIEVALGRHPKVDRSVVVARDDVSDQRDTRLVAYIVCGPEAAPTVSELHRFLRDNLPEHMVPSAFVVLDALPLLPNGKIDPRRLPRPDRSRPALARELRAPSTPIEEALAEIFRELTGLAQVGVYDSFFELGGHSLVATQAVSRIRETFEIDVPLRAFFESPRIVELALGIEEALIARVEALSEQEIEALSCRRGEP